MRAAVLLLTGCSLPKSDPRSSSLADTSLWAPASLQVHPDAVDFGAVALGDRASRAIQVANVGGDDLALNELRLDYDASSIELDWAGVEILAAGASIDLSITWRPREAQDLSSWLVIGTNDPGEYKVAVWLTGVIATPQIEVDPTSTDFGEVPLGWATVQTVAIVNVGYADLEIQSVSFQPTDPDDLTMEPIETPFVLPWGEQCKVTIQFAPTDEGKDQAVMTVQSNDSDTPTVHAELHGTGVADADTGT